MAQAVRAALHAGSLDLGNLAPAQHGPEPSPTEVSQVLVRPHDTSRDIERGGEAMVHQNGERPSVKVGQPSSKVMTTGRPGKGAGQSAIAAANCVTVIGVYW